MERRLEEYFETTRIVKITNLTFPLSKKRDKNKKSCRQPAGDSEHFIQTHQRSLQIYLINSRIFTMMTGASLGVVIKTI
jgi:hypothetical protein